MLALEWQVKLSHFLFEGSAVIDIDELVKILYLLLSCESKQVLFIDLHLNNQHVLLIVLLLLLLTLLLLLFINLSFHLLDGIFNVFIIHYLVNKLIILLLLLMWLLLLVSMLSFLILFFTLLTFVFSSLQSSLSSL